MKPTKITKGGVGCIIVASYGTFQHWYKHKKFT